MAMSKTVQQESPSSVRVNKVSFMISVVGLAVQGLAALVIYGTAASTNAFFLSMSQIGLSHDTALPILAAVDVFTAGVFVIGLAGTIWLRSTKGRKVRRGAIFALVSAVLAVTTVWGYLLGSLLMLAGSIMGFKTIHRANQ